MLAAQGALDQAPWPARLRAYAHLAICRYCRKFKRQLALISSALRETAFPAPDAARIAALEKAVIGRLRS